MTQSLTLEFLPRKRFPWLLAPLAIVTAVTCLVSYSSYHAGQEELSRHQSAMERVQLELARERAQLAERRKVQGPVLQSRLQAESRMQRSLNYDWNVILRGLEQATAPGISVVAFTHDASARSGQLTVLADDLPALMRFVDALNRDANTGSWRLASYGVQPDSSVRTVKATVLYVPRER